MKKRSKNNSGQTLIEVMVGLTISSFLIAAITILSVQSVSNSEFGKNKSLAGLYGQQGIEFIKRLRDSQNSTYQSYYGPQLYCIPQDLSLPLPIPQENGLCGAFNINNNFSRTVEITPNDTTYCGGSSLDRVSVAVSWRENTCRPYNYCHNIIMQSCLQSVVESFPTP